MDFRSSGVDFESFKNQHQNILETFKLKILCGKTAKYSVGGPAG